MIHQHLKTDTMMQKNLLTSSALHQHYQQLGVNSKKFLKNKASTAAKDLSKTTFALYLLRFNVALQIAVAANVINLALAIATFWYGFNSLYCAFGMDCVIGTITSCILIWRFASAKHEHLIKHQQQQQQQQQHQSSNLYFLNNFTESSSLLYGGNKTRLGRLVPATTNGGGGGGGGAAKFDLLESCRSIAEEDTIISGHDAEDHIRELWSTFWLGQVMIVSGIGVVIRTLVEVISHVMLVEAVQVGEATDLVITYNVPESSSSFSTTAAAATSMEPLYILALLSLALNLLLMVAKLVVYLFLRSNSMLIEGVNSFISALFAAVAAISICYSDSVAYLDQIVSILFGIFLIIYGGYNMLVTISQTVYQVVKKNSRPQGYESIV